MEEERIFFKGFCMVVDGHIKSANGVAVDAVKKVKTFINTADFDNERLEEVAQGYIQSSDIAVGRADEFVKNSRFFNPDRNNMVVDGSNAMAIESNNNHTCVKCGHKLSDKVYYFCKERGWDTLCFNCQPNRKRNKF